jgi:PAS domain S-box-containing protein
VVDSRELIELLVAASGVIGILVGAMWACVRLGRRAGRILPTVDNLHFRFGETPIEELHRIVSSIQSSVGEIEIRQRIAERHLAIGVYVCDTEGRCTWANDYLCEAFGLDSTEMQGHGWLAAVASSERIRVHAAWVAAVSSQIPYEERYKVVNRHDASEWNAITEAWPVKVEDRILCYVGYVTRSKA